MSPALTASRAALVLTVAGSKARSAKHSRTDALAIRVSGRTAGKTGIRRRTGRVALPAGLCSPRQHDEEQPAQGPLQDYPPPTRPLASILRVVFLFTRRDAGRVADREILKLMARFESRH